MSVVIVRAVQTCGACPAQWDAWDDQGRYWYLRYRYGRGSAEQYADEAWYEDRDAQPAAVAEFECGGSLDGSISLEEFAERAGMTLSLPEEV